MIEIENLTKRFGPGWGYKRDTDKGRLSMTILARPD